MKEEWKLFTLRRMKVSELIARLMAAIEPPDDLTQDDVDCLLEDAHITLKEIQNEEAGV